MVSSFRRVTWTREAEAALDEVLGYIAGKSPQGARTMLEDVLAAAGELSTLCDRGRVVPETSDPAIRETFVRKHRLMYQILGDEVTILAFIHGARDFAKWRSEQ